VAADFMAADSQPKRQFSGRHWNKVTARILLFQKTEATDMKRFLFPLVLLLFPGLLAAQSPFDGTWVAKPETTQLPKRPEIYSLQNGIYECESCVPKIKATADGNYYPIAGSPYFSAVAVRVIDGHTIKIIEKEKEKVVYKETDKVSADGDTLRQDVTDLAAPNGEAVVAQETFQRVSAGAPDAGAISGSWLAKKIEFTSKNGITVTYRSTAQGLQACNPGGEGYDAKFDGKEYPVHGDPTHSTVSLKKINANTIVETDRQDGRVHYMVRMTVSRDGKTMKVTETDEERGAKTTYVLEKESS
jgi:hypothetical protein